MAVAYSVLVRVWFGVADFLNLSDLANLNLSDLANLVNLSDLANHASYRYNNLVDGNNPCHHLANFVVNLVHLGSNSNTLRPTGGNLQRAFRDYVQYTSVQV